MSVPLQPAVGGSTEQPHVRSDADLIDFEMPGDDDILGKVRADLLGKNKQVSDHLLTKHLEECRRMALDQIKVE